MNILEVGCGTYKTAAFNPRTPSIAETTFIDIDHLRWPIQNFIQADTQHLPFRNQTFHIIYASHILEHLERPHQFLAECKRLLVQGGRIHIWVPSFSNRGAKNPDHKTIFTYFTLKEILMSSGFSVTMHFNHWLFNFKFLPKSIAKILVMLTIDEFYAEGQNEASNPARARSTYG